MGIGCQVTNRTTGDSFTCGEGQSVLKAMEQWGVKCVAPGETSEQTTTRALR